MDSMIVTSLRAQAAFLAERNAQLGYSGTDYVAVNPGQLRTPAKQSLLRRLASLARSKGKQAKFSANF